MWYWIGSALYLLFSYLVFRVIIKNDYLKGKLTWLSISLEFLVFGIHANLPYLYFSVRWPGIPPLPDNLFQTWTGLILTGLGILLTLSGMVYLSGTTTLGQGSLAVRQTGFYRWTRNPQLLTYGLILIGLAILYPSIESAVWILVYGLVAQLMVLTEEEHLLKVFGKDYLDYCSRVPRYLSMRRPKQIQ